MIKKLTLMFALVFAGAALAIIQPSQALADNCSDLWDDVYETVWGNCYNAGGSVAECHQSAVLAADTETALAGCRELQ
jgi:hypothetical protein